MSLDPMIQALFQRMPQLAHFPTWERTPAQARQEFKWLCQLADPRSSPIGKSEDIKAAGPLGAIPLRVYTPVASGSAALPAIIYFLGGGFVVGDLDCYDGLCRALANESGCRVVSVDYRLAPEFPFPAAVDDCFAAAEWIEEHAVVLGVVFFWLVVVGVSVGGFL